MRLLASLLFLLSACASTPQMPAAALDVAARDFVRLSLEMGTHEEGYIDAYFGPPDVKAEAEAHPRSVAELKIEADRIAAAVEAVSPTRLAPIERKRRAHLLAYVRSARFRLDMIDGVRAPFQDEAEKLFAMRPDLRLLESFDATLARIEALVPGPGPLSERVEAYKARFVIPADRLQAVMAVAIAECRARTLAHIPLPANEAFHMEFVAHQSWSAYNWYQGNAQSLIQVNTDLPIFIDRALGLGCHEGYPGHHVQGIFQEKLYKERGWIEFAVSPLFSPQGPLNEGGANVGVELAFPGAERLAFEAGALYPLAGLDPATAPAYNALRVALADLAGARISIAAMYLDGRIDRARALELIQHYQLVSRARAEQSLAFTDHYRSYVINYANGEDLVRAYVARAGDGGAQWAAYARMAAEPTLPGDLL